MLNTEQWVVLNTWEKLCTTSFPPPITRIEHRAMGSVEHVGRMVFTISAHMFLSGSFSPKKIDKKKGKSRSKIWQDEMLCIWKLACNFMIIEDLKTNIIGLRSKNYFVLRDLNFTLFFIDFFNFLKIQQNLSVLTLVNINAGDTH